MRLMLVAILLNSLGCTSITIVGTGNQVTVEKGTADEFEADTIEIETIESPAAAGADAKINDLERE